MRTELLVDIHSGIIVPYRMSTREYLMLTYYTDRDSRKKEHLCKLKDWEAAEFQVIKLCVELKLI